MAHQHPVSFCVRTGAVHHLHTSACDSQHPPAAEGLMSGLEKKNLEMVKSFLCT